MASAAAGLLLSDPQLFLQLVIIRIDFSIGIQSFVLFFFGLDPLECSRSEAAGNGMAPDIAQKIFEFPL